ncbi:hypothetical protein ACKI1J_11240 [Streptomyces scabiei]|uniref:hypothetical protein n=1 Tax=Streptomyces scabiei TaxID=1930 RepID=UPI0038F6415F
MAGALLVTIGVGLLGTAAPASGPRGADSASYPTGPGGEAVNDSFFFVHRTLTGDGSLTVALRSLTGVADSGTGRTVPGAQPWAKAGIIVKESLAQGSPYAAVLATGGHGVRLQYDWSSPVVEDPEWQRRLQQVAPMPAGLAVQSTVRLNELPIGPWAGLGVLAAWAGVALLTGGLLLRGRDA